MRTLLLLTLAFSAAAGAAPRPDPNLLPTPPILTASPVAMMIAAMDLNGDARVTRAELGVAETRMFGAADSDKDGVLTLIELADWSLIWLGDQSAVPGRFDFDRDGDDKVSKAEFAAELDRRFAGFDANKDGVLERFELLTVTQRQRDRKGRLMDPLPEDGRQRPR